MYATMSTLRKLMKYEQHKWKISGDLKLVSLLLSLRDEYRKYSYIFVYEQKKSISQTKIGIFEINSAAFKYQRNVFLIF